MLTWLMPQILGPLDVEMAAILNVPWKKKKKVANAITGDAISKLKEYEKELDVLALHSSQAKFSCLLSYPYLGLAFARTLLLSIKKELRSCLMDLSRSMMTCKQVHQTFGHLVTPSKSTTLSSWLKDGLSLLQALQMVKVKW
jgi:hypothetical protein